MKIHRSRIYSKDTTSVKTSGRCITQLCKDEYRHPKYIGRTADARRIIKYIDYAFNGIRSLRCTSPLTLTECLLCLHMQGSHSEKSWAQASKQLIANCLDGSSLAVLLTDLAHFLFLDQSSFLLSSPTRVRGFYPERPSGQAVVTGGAFPSPPRRMHSLPSRMSGSAFPLVSCLCFVNVHGTLHTHALVLSAR